MPELMFCRLTKVDETQRLVYGILANETVDKTGEIFDYDTSKQHVLAWSGEIEKATEGKSVGNLREMHDKKVVGRFVKLDCDDATKSVNVCAKISDDVAWKKVTDGDLTGFSIGGEYLAKFKDPDGKGIRYTAKPSEGSIVDNPANPDSHFQLIKSDGSEELRKFAPPKPAEAPDLAQVWQAKDGKTFATKALAKAHNDELANAPVPGPAEKLQAAIEEAKAAIESVQKREFSDKERQDAADSGAAMPDGSYPIKSVQDLKNAIQAYGRAKNKSKVKAHIIARAKALNADGELPDAWKPGADKALMALELRKGMHGVSRLALLIQELEWLQQEQEWEEKAEGDTASKLPASLKESVVTLCAVLGEMVHEEGGELLDEDEMFAMGERLEMALTVKGGMALAKCLAKSHPKLLEKASADQAHALEQAHGHMAKAGANCANPPKDDWRGDGDGENEEKFYKAVVGKGARHSGETQAHLDSAHSHLDELGKCGKAHSGAEQVHVNAAHDHMAKAGFGCGMSKAGAKHSAADMHHGNAAHDQMVKAGAVCPMDKSITDNAHEMAERDAEEQREAAADKSVVATLTKALDDTRSELAKTQTDAAKMLTEVTERLKKLEDQPVPRPHERQAGPYRVVGKGEEDTSEQLNQAIEKMSPTEKADFAFRMIHRNGPMIMGPQR